MRLIGLLALALLMGACTQMTTKTGDCTTSDGDVTWVFYNEMPLTTGWTKCIYCGANIAKEDLYDFIQGHYAGYPEDRQYLLEGLEEQLANAEQEGVDINESLTPCFYTYNSYGQYNTATPEGCEQDACLGPPSINDMVGRGHGAWSVARRLLNVNYDAD